MVISTSYIIENDKEFAAQIKAAAERVGDLRLAFTLIAKDWRKSNMAQFSLRGSGQYPPLSAMYAARKKKVYGNRPILVAKGRLRDSLTGSPNGDSIQEITKTSLTMGTRVPYGIYHQSDAPRFKIPLRKFLFIGPEAPRSASSAITGRLERWLSILEAEVQRKLKGA
jgi:phage gpG-like protein